MRLAWPDGERGYREEPVRTKLGLRDSQGNPDSVRSRQPKTTAQKETCCYCTDD